jgi:hypothetical protein
MDDRHHDPEDRFEQISRHLMRWVLGPGLLSVHVGVYLVTLVTLLLWNLLRSPSDIWVDEPLRRWGLVVVFHATAVAAGWTAWRLMRMGEATTTPDVRARAPRPRAIPAVAPQPATSEAWPVRSATAIATTEEWARRWLRESVRVVRDTVGPHAGTNGNGHAEPPVISTASGVAGPSITEWGTLFARRTREMMTAAREHLTSSQYSSDGSDPASAAMDAPSADPARTWPTAENGPQPAAGFSPPVVSRTWPTPANGPADGFDPPITPPHGNGATPQTSPGPDPLTAAASEAPRGGEAATMSEDARWTWVEAAAAAWLARREMDEPAAETVDVAPPPVDDPTATP